MSTLFASWNTGDNQGIVIGSAPKFWNAQIFKTDISFNITSVKLKMWKFSGSPGDVTVSIRACDGTGHPIGDDLVVGTTNGNTLSGSSPGTFREITFGSTTRITANTFFGIVVRVLGNTGTIIWRYEDPGGYADGRFRNSADFGVTWGESGANQDLMFEAYGDAFYVSFPTEAITRVTNFIIRYNRKEGIFTQEVSLGEVTSDFGLPQWLSRPQPAVEGEEEEELVRRLGDGSGPSFAVIRAAEESGTRISIIQKLFDIEEKKMFELGIEPEKPELPRGVITPPRELELTREPISSQVATSAQIPSTGLLVNPETGAAFFTTEALLKGLLFDPVSGALSVAPPPIADSAQLPDLLPAPGRILFNNR